MKRHATATILLGQAGVFQVASQLLLRGYNPSIPACDVGADLMLDNLRIQVKATRLSLREQRSYPNGAYFFKVSRMLKGRNRSFTFVRRELAQECDFVIFWGVEENRFWIVPSSVIDGMQCFILGPTIQHKDIDIDEIVRMRDAGIEPAQIAAALDVSERTVWRRLQTRERESKYPRCRIVRALENRWDLIAERLRGSGEPSEVLNNVEPLVREG